MKLRCILYGEGKNSKVLVFTQKCLQDLQKCKLRRNKSEGRETSSLWDILTGENGTKRSSLTTIEVYLERCSSCEVKKAKRLKISGLIQEDILILSILRSNEWREIKVKVENTIHLELMALSVLRGTRKTVNSEDFETFICYCKSLPSFCNSRELRQDTLA